MLETMLKNQNIGLLRSLMNSFNSLGSKKLHKEINYTVYIPENLNIEIEHSYGNILLEETKGDVDIHLSYGKFLADALLGTKNSIELDYSLGSEIKHLRNGVLDCDYSRIDFNHVGELKINSDYSDITIEDINTLSYDVDYGSLKVYDVESFVGESDYAKIHAYKVLNKADIDASYGGVVVRMEPDFKELNISTSYTGSRVELSKMSSVYHTLKSSYCNVKGLNNLTRKKYEKDGSSLSFIGELQSDKSLRSKVDAKVSYGKFNLSLY